MTKSIINYWLLIYSILLTLILFGEDDVITYAVVDENNLVHAEYFNNQDADDSLQDSNDDNYGGHTFRLVELCNGLELE